MEGYVLWGQQEGSLMGGLPGKLQTSSSHGKPVWGRHWPWQLTLEGAGRLGRSHKLFQTTKTWKPVWQQLWRYDYAPKRHSCSRATHPQTNNSCTICTCSAHCINICTTPSFEIRHYIHENLLKAHLNHQKYLPGENGYYMIDSVGMLWKYCSICRGQCGHYYQAMGAAINSMCPFSCFSHLNCPMMTSRPWLIWLHLKLFQCCPYWAQLL